MTVHHATLSTRPSHECMSSRSAVGVHSSVDVHIVCRAVTAFVAMGQHVSPCDIMYRLVTSYVSPCDSMYHLVTACITL